ncbi:nuclear transport factor 2 family protein [Maribacter sp. 4U21]|uniref:nuclear transport factor 2 family protein n=1 Tax=Maribacter sp. 4U21 TaxID=1889779 RepID=UPI00117CFB2E|nr:nuclear transport factor 2 family protein [Maribacter sp. 4U21]
MLSSVTVGAQIEVLNIQREIDTSVWRPFQKAFEALDGEALNRTYAKEVLRVTLNGIDTNNSFKSDNIKRFDKNREDGASITLDFWFDSRHTNETTSYEVGFYKIGTTYTGKELSYNYGQFHIVIKKIDGHWKITQDWDTTHINGNNISQEDFQKQEFLKF